MWSATVIELGRGRRGPTIEKPGLGLELIRKPSSWPSSLACASISNFMDLRWCPRVCLSNTRLARSANNGWLPWNGVVDRGCQLGDYGLGDGHFGDEGAKGGGGRKAGLGLRAWGREKPGGS